MDDPWTRRIADRLRWYALEDAHPATHPHPPAPPPPSPAATVAPTPALFPPAQVLDTAAAITAVVHSPDNAEFVRRAYQLTLGRDPSPGELAQRVRRLKYIPFYTRGRMLRGLLGSVEAQLVRRAEQVRAEKTAKQTIEYLGVVVPHAVSSEERLGAALAQLRRAVDRTNDLLAAVDGRVTALDDRLSLSAIQG